MAVKTYYLGSGQDGNFAALFDGVAQTAASRTDGWTVAKIAANNYSNFDAGTKQTSGTFGSSGLPTSLLTGATANALKTPAPLTGTFANTAWTLIFQVRAITASSQAGRINAQIYKSANADGSAATLIAALQQGTTSLALTTTTDAGSTVTFNPGAITLNNEYLFFTIAWNITTASGSNSGDVVLRTGSTGPAGTRIITPDLVLPKIETLTDSFDTSIDKTNKWPGSNAATVWDSGSGGRAKLPCATTYSLLATRQTSPAYDLTGSSIFAKMTVPALGNASKELWLDVLCDTGTGNKFSMVVSGTDLIARRTLAGATSGQFTVPYNATTHAWWRIRESGGTVYFDTSPDGSTWTNIYSRVNGMTVTACWVSISSGYFGTETASDAYVDYINVVPPPTFPTRPIIDNFNRADQYPLGSNWYGSITTGGWRVSSNTAFCPSTDIAIWQNVSQTTPDCEVYATFVTVGAVGYGVSVFARKQAVADSRYYLNILPGSGYNYGALYKLVNGVSTQLGATVFQAWAPGDKIGISAIGNQIKFMYSIQGGPWTAGVTVTDTDITTPGEIGITGSGNWVIDDFGGGEVRAAITHYGTVSMATLLSRSVNAAKPAVYGSLVAPFTAAISIAGIGVHSAYKSAILTDGPQGYWKLDETSGTAISAVSGGINLNNTNDGGGTTGLLAAEPASKGRLFVAANTPFLSSPAQAFKYNTITWELWLKRTRTNVGEIVMDQYNGGLRLTIQANGTLTLEHSYGSIIASTVNTKILDTNAHHVVVTRNGIGGTVIFYVDGVAETGTPGAEFSYDVSGWPNYSFFIGSSWGNSPFDGTIDEAAVYNTVLTPTQVTNHYTLGTIGPPPAVTYYGTLAAPFTFNAVTAAQKKTFATVAAPFSFNRTVAATRKTFGVTTTPLIFNATDTGIRKTFGVTTTPLTFTKAVGGARKTFSSIVAPFTFNATDSGIRKVLASTTTAITFTKSVAATRKTFSSTVAPFTFNRVTAASKQTFGQFSAPTVVLFTTNGTATTGKQTYFGVVVAPFTFSATDAAQRKTFANTTTALSFNKQFKGIRTATGVITAPFTFGAVTAAQRKAITSFVAAFVFNRTTAAQKKTFATTVAAFTFTKSVAATRKTYSTLVAPFTLNRSVASTRKTFASTITPITFGVTTVGNTKSYGSTTTPLTFKATTFGDRWLGAQTYYGVVDRTITFGATTAARRKTFATTTSPITFGAVIAGKKKTFAALVTPFVFSATNTGKRKTFSGFTMPITNLFTTGGGRVAQQYYGTFVRPFTFNAVTAGRRKTFSSISAPFVFDRTSTINYNARGSTLFAFAFISVVNGNIRTVATVLNDADALCLGSKRVDNVYVGAIKVWPVA